MISKKVKVLASSFAIAVLGVAIVEVVISKPSNLVLSSENQYTLNFAGKKISDATSSYEGEKSATVITALNNPITFKAANVIDNDGGWQTILPGGYFYNPIDASSTHNKISGLKSVLFTSGSNVKLSLHYGSTINNEDIIYSRKVELTANETYTFEDSPSYVYLKNEGESNVVINNFAIDYTCADSGYQKQDYKVLMIGNSFSDDTIFFANRIANSYGINLTIVDAFIAFW